MFSARSLWSARSAAVAVGALVALAAVIAQGASAAPTVRTTSSDQASTYRLITTAKLTAAARAKGTAAGKRAPVPILPTDKTIGYVHFDGQSASSQRLESAIRAIGKHLGYKVIACDPAGDPQKVRQWGTSLVAQGAGLIMSYQHEPIEFGGVLRDAKSKGALWVNVGEGVTPGALMSQYYADEPVRPTRVRPMAREKDQGQGEEIRRHRCAADPRPGGAAGSAVRPATGKPDQSRHATSGGLDRRQPRSRPRQPGSGHARQRKEADDAAVAQSSPPCGRSATSASRCSLRPPEIARAQSARSCRGPEHRRRQLPASGRGPSTVSSTFLGRSSRGSPLTRRWQTGRGRCRWGSPASWPGMACASAIRTFSIEPPLDVPDPHLLVRLPLVLQGEVGRGVQAMSGRLVSPRSLTILHAPGIRVHRPSVVEWCRSRPARRPESRAAGGGCQSAVLRFG